MSKQERFECFIDEWDENDWYIKDNKNNEHFEYLEDVTKLLNQQDRKISDLETKLAESEEKINMLEEHKFYADNIVNAYADKCKKYEQQLAEKEEDLKDAEEHIDNLELQLREQYQLVDEKDEEIEKQNRRISLLEKYKNDQKTRANDYYKQCKQANQDKISFCIEQLEKVKELVHNHIKEITNDLSDEDDERLNQKHTIHGLATAIVDIDNQIKELKEENK